MPTVTLKMKILLVIRDLMAFLYSRVENIC